MDERDELKVEPFGPLDALYAAVRRRAPQIAATCAETPVETPETLDLRELGKLGLRLCVSYRDRPARRIAWDSVSETYVWSSGPDAGARLAADVEQAATRIAWALGAPISPEPPAG
ncbi:hypothetical protein AGRA3207_005539 [Actinomadura graeca]|uniref:Uncharacterized protein n=1 Tax=Actinomadura graeca TaxID=2750812 RepID=A0ABX8QZN7_9ACTN|nr:hypothetical protein [Actinomadura graeca]QXJ24255.1 hypothetical protein AGRA3207_005539 [Actinomadura graeca]